MKSAMKLVTAIAAAGMVSLVALAGATGELCKHRLAKGTPVEVGEWHAGLAETRQFAEDNGLPLVAVWSNGDSCSHCTKYENDVNSEPFRAYMKKSGIVFFFAHSGDPKPDGPEGGEVHKWCSRGWSISAYPYVRFYWKKDGKLLVDKVVTGDTADGSKGRYTGSKKTKKPGYPDFIDDGETDYDTYNPGGRYAAWYITNSVSGVFKDYTPEPTYIYAGGVFTTSSMTITNGVTKSLNLQLQREDSVKHLIATNWFRVSVNGGAPIVGATPIVWNSAEKSKTYSYDLPTDIDYATTNVYVVSLLDDQKSEQSTLTITAVPNPYTGSDFNVGGHEHDSLVVVTGRNSFVDVPLTRKNAAKASVNNLVVTYQVVSAGELSTVCQTNEVKFAAGETGKTVRIQLPAGKDGVSVAPGQILLTLTYLDGDRATERSSVSIQVLDEDLSNSSTNPYWIGERTSKTLDWGEWTMDLEAAKQKAADADGAAYTLILVGGSKWCPDCVNVDRWLLDQPQFSAWARARKVTCVTIDLPRVGLSEDKTQTKLSSYPSLLTYESDKVSDRYVKACEDGELSRYQSGASYLSRHGVPMTGNGGTNATAVAARNARLLLTSTEEGGLCRPDCLDVGNEQTMQFKTGIPALIVMDKTGRIIGRNFQFNNESPESFKSCYITRMDELLTQQIDLSEEVNDSYKTTEDALPLRGNTGVGDDAKTISYNDVNDWYRVSPNAVNAKCVYDLKGDVEAEVQLRVVQIKSNGELYELTKVKGSLKTGLTAVVEKVPSNCYVCVSAPLTSPTWGVTYGYFALTNSASTVAPYVLSSDTVLCPAEVVQSFTVAPDESLSATVEIESGKNYRFSGQGVISDNRVSYNAAGDYYVANETCRLTVPLAQTTFLYQIWNPGLVAFSVVSARVKEPTDAVRTTTYKLRVNRVGGTSGTARISIAVDQSRSTQLDDVYVFADDGKVLEWKEGETDTRELSVEILSNNFADGDQRVVFVLTAEEDSEVKVGVANEFELTIADDADPSIPGKVEICSTIPAKAGSIVYAKAGSVVKIGLDRIGGANGQVGCSLKATAGVLDSDSFVWGSRDVSVKAASLSLADVAAGRTVQVTMTPDKGTKAVTANRSFTVMTVAADAPEFVTNEVVYTVFRNVDMKVDPVGVKAGAGKVTVSRPSGQIPGGIKAAYDDVLKSLVFTGVPTGRAGTYESVFRVANGSVKGLVVSVTFVVIDPVASSTQSGTALNESCAKSRTFSDLQVFDSADCSRLIGMMTLTIPPSGRLSAKYVSVSGTVSLVSKNWSSVKSTGELTAKLTGGTAATVGYQMTVTAFADGSISCYFRDPSYHAGELSILEPGAEWTKLDDGASDWQGYYTASMAQKSAVRGESRAMGDGYITFKMNTASAISKGKMSYAGMLPNGRGFSGSRTLWGFYDEEVEKTVMAYIPVFATSKSDDVSGLVLIAPGASTEEPGCRGRSIYSDKNTYELFDTNKFVWVCKEGVKADLGYETVFDVHGGFYSSTDDFAGSCSAVFKNTSLTFFALTEKCPLPLTEWKTNDTAVSVKPVSNKNSIKLVTAKNKQNLTLTFTLSTGVISGTMNFTDALGNAVKASYKGIVMPGWGSASCEECSWQTETEKRPFVSGACWFDNGFRYGCPFSIGIEAGR